MGTVSGSFVLAERGGGGGGGGGAGEVGSSRTLVAQRTELEAKSREISELRAQLGLPRGAAAKELASISFSLRGVGLAAMDRNILSKNSSDPYFVLHALDASGQLKKLGKSNTVKANLDPTWEVLEVEAERLGGARQLKLEVWDWDLGQSDDLIGEALFELADVHAMLRQGQHRADLPSLLLSDPKAKDAAKSRGAVEGSYALLEKADMKERLLGKLRADVEERDQEISRLRAQPGMPQRG